MRVLYFPVCCINHIAWLNYDAIPEGDKCTCVTIQNLYYYV